MDRKTIGVVSVVSAVLLLAVVPVAKAAVYSAMSPFTVGSASSSAPVFIANEAGIQIQGATPTITFKKDLVNQIWQFRDGGANQYSAGFDLYNANTKKTALYVNPDGNLTIGSSTSALESRLYVWGGPNGANIDVRGDRSKYAGDQATIELEGADYDTLPNSAMLQYYGSGAIGSTMGFPNNHLGHLQFAEATVGLIHTTNAAPLVFGTQNIERMRIDANGNIGIGVTNPASVLHVSAAPTATTTVTFGDLTSPDSKSCVNMKTSAGTPASFYFDASGKMVVEQNYCK